MENLTEKDPSAVQLERIQRTSNVIQALENVLLQCGHDASCADLRAETQTNLSAYRSRLRTLIHNGHHGIEIDE